MERQKVLVCGATGFIGRNIAISLARRNDMEVIGVHNKRPTFDASGITWVQADLTNPDDVSRVVEDADIIVQAAATTSGSKDIITRPYIHVTNNAVMNSLIFRAAYEASVNHIVFFSCTVMLQSRDISQTETDFDPTADLHPNYFGIGWTKLYVEKMCEFYARIGETKYTAIRHSNIYGPHDKFDLEHSHVFGATVTKVLSSTNGKIIVWGAGEEARDLLYVDDLSNFIGKAIDHQEARFGLYNCGVGHAVSIKSLVDRIIAVSGHDLVVEHDQSKPSIKTSLSLNCAKAKAELGWEARTSLDEGIRKTINWWREQEKV